MLRLNGQTRSVPTFISIEYSLNNRERLQYNILIYFKIVLISTLTIRSSRRPDANGRREHNISVGTPTVG